MVNKLEPRAILAKAYRDNGDIGAANYIEAGHDLLPDTQVHLLAIRDALEARTPANGEQVERVARAIYEEDDPWHKAWAWPDLNPEAQGGATAADRYRDIARAAIAAMDPTPTQDARERVKVLEEALEGMVYAYGDPDAGEVDRRLAMKDARAALGNQETDRHG